MTPTCINSSAVSSASNSCDSGPANAKPTCAPEASITTDTLLEFSDNDYIRRMDALDDQLGDAIAFFDREVGVAEVEQNHLDFASIVDINDSSTYIDAVLGSKA
jgi:hypothetical protein